MSDFKDYTYKNDYSRYRQYYHRLWIFYQKPTAKVSVALLLTIFTIIFFAVFAIRPTLLTVAELVKKIQDKKESLTQIEQKAAQLASAQQAYIAAQSNLPLLDLALPADLADGGGGDAHRPVLHVPHAGSRRTRCGAAVPGAVSGPGHLLRIATPGPQAAVSRRQRIS